MVCEEFIESGLAVGVIHDNPQHGQMLGGLCHFDAQKLRVALAGLPSDSVGAFDASSLDGFLSEMDDGSHDWGKHGSDQNVLNWVVGWLARPREGEPLRVLEHSLFTTVGEGGRRHHRAGPTITNADFRTSVAMPAPALVEEIKRIVRDKSDSFINYLGASGFDTERALGFYSAYSPAAEAVREAERLAGGGAL